MECSVKPGGSTRQFWAVWMVSGIGPNNKWQRGCWKFPWVLASNAHWQIYYTMAWYFIIIALERRHHPHVTTTGNSARNAVTRYSIKIFLRMVFKSRCVGIAHIHTWWTFFSCNMEITQLRSWRLGLSSFIALLYFMKPTTVISWSCCQTDTSLHAR